MQQTLKIIALRDCRGAELILTYNDKQDKICIDKEVLNYPFGIRFHFKGTVVLLRHACEQASIDYHEFSMPVTVDWTTGNLMTAQAVPSEETK